MFVCAPDGVAFTVTITAADVLVASLGSAVNTAVILCAPVVLKVALKVAVAVVPVPVKVPVPSTTAASLKVTVPVGV